MCKYLGFNYFYFTLFLSIVVCFHLPCLNVNWGNKLGKQFQNPEFYTNKSA